MERNQAILRLNTLKDKIEKQNEGWTEEADLVKYVCALENPPAALWPRLGRLTSLQTFLSSLKKAQRSHRNTNICLEELFIS